MHANVATRPLLWDKVYAGHPADSPVTAVTVPDNRFALEGHELVIVEVGTTDTDDTTVLHVPDLDLVVAGDVIYNGVHMYLAQSAVVGGFGPWRDAIDKVEALEPRHIVAGHQNKQLDDDAERHDRGDPAVPRRRRRAPADRDHRRRLLQRQARALPGPPRADRPVGGRQRALRRPRTPRGGHRARSFSPPGFEPRCHAVSRAGNRVPNWRVVYGAPEPEGDEVMPEGLSPQEVGKEIAEHAKPGGEERPRSARTG